MKKILTILACTAMVLTLLLFGSWFYLNSSFFADLLAQKCQDLSGSSLKFKKNPKITLFPATLSMEDIIWQSDKKDLEINFSARFLRISISLSSLLNDQVYIPEIFASNASLEIKNKNQNSPPPTQDQAEDKKNNSQIEKFPLLLNRIVLQNSSFSYTGLDQALSLSRINLSAEHFGPRQETDVKCDFFISWGSSESEESNKDLAGNVAIRTKLRYYAPNLTFRQTALTYTSTSGQFLTSLSPIAMEAEGSLNLNDLSIHLGNSLLKTLNCQLSLKGDYRSLENTFNAYISLDYNPMPTHPKLEAAKLPSNYNVVMAGPVLYKDNIIDFPDIAISSGASKGSGKIKYIFASPGQAPKLQGKLDSCILNLYKKKKDEKIPTKTQVVRKKKNSNQGFSWPDIDIAFSAPAINYDKFSCQDIQFQLQGSSGKYDLKNLNFLWASGRAQGSAQINVPHQILMLKTTGTDINIGKALWELGIDGFQNGMASFEANLAFSGFEGLSMKKSLAGNFSFNAQHVKVSLLEEMSKFLTRFSPKTALLPDGIDDFTVKAHAENGKINLDPLLFESKALKAVAHGKIDLLTDRLDAQLSLNVFGMNLPIAIDGKLSKLSWHIEPTWFKRFFETDAARLEHSEIYF